MWCRPSKTRRRTLRPSRARARRYSLVAVVWRARRYSLVVSRAITAVLTSSLEGYTAVLTSSLEGSALLTSSSSLEGSALLTSSSSSLEGSAVLTSSLEGYSASHQQSTALSRAAPRRSATQRSACDDAEHCCATPEGQRCMLQGAWPRRELWRVRTTALHQHACCSVTTAAPIRCPVKACLRIYTHFTLSSSACLPAGETVLREYRVRAGR
jgi:hypothetical protein